MALGLKISEMPTDGNLVDELLSRIEQLIDPTAETLKLHGRLWEESDSEALDTGAINLDFCQEVKKLCFVIPIYIMIRRHFIILETRRPRSRNTFHMPYGNLSAIVITQ